MKTKLERMICNLLCYDIDMIDLAGERLSSDDIKNLVVAIKEKGTIKKLILGGVVFGSDLKDDSMPYLASLLCDDRCLEYLDLRSNHITDQGLDVLKRGLINNHNLSFLDLRFNSISDCAVNKLVDELSIKNKQLTLAAGD